MLAGRVHKQIVVVTDGHSNVGECPVYAAGSAREIGITVSAVGILDTGNLGAQGRREIEDLARAGGGVASFVPMASLSYTIHTVTNEATRLDITRHLNKRLRQAAGITLPELSPGVRSALLPLLSDMEDEVELHLVLAVDCSGSMVRKRTLLEQGLRDLMLSLAGRRGKVRLGIIQFPGRGGNASLIKPLYFDNSSSSRILREIKLGGMTPTGPAIYAAARELTLGLTEMGRPVAAL